MAETWYVLEDGTAVHPDEVAPDETGALKHQSGAYVAMRGPVPSTRSVYDDDKVTSEAKPDAKAKRGYKTREG